MLKLTHDQVRQLQARENEHFVTRLRAALVADFPEVDGADLGQRLRFAHERALGLGLDRPRVVTQFLYQEAFAPGFHERPAVAAWLARPGAPAEQRWRDFVALAGSQMGVQ